MVDAPVPRPDKGELLCQTLASLISSGTERMLLDFGRAGWLNKARQQPEKVRQVLDKVQSDGLMATWKSVNGRLEQALPLGYCNVSRLLEGDPSAMKDAGLSLGQRLVSNSPHAEFFCTRPTCCAPVPDRVSDEAAAFTVLGAVGLQGVRLANPTLGEYFAVMGLGLIGLMTVQILLANGCRVLGIDLDPAKCKLAESFGARTVALSSGKDPLSPALDFTKGRGMDGVLLTAATGSNEIVSQAAAMCRKRGRLILVGTAGLNLKRSDFYEKELSFQVSCAYGPGRYDLAYEAKGQDYPLAYVRWTMKRNFEAVLNLMADGKLDVSPLISHRFDFADAPAAFDLMYNKEPHLGLLLQYADEPRLEKAPCAPAKTVAPAQTDKPVAGVFGAGLYAANTMLPILNKAGVELRSIVSPHGSNAALAAKRFGFKHAFSREEEVWSDANINTVFILTRHDQHARMVIEALRSGRHVYVEKPLCLTLEELQAISDAHTAALDKYPGLKFMVGFNRRFAPLISEMDALLADDSGAKSFVMTVNAGYLPPDHWLLDHKIGGGRIIGEAVHYIDLLQFLVKKPIVKACMIPEGSEGSAQSAAISLGFADGSLGAVHYLCGGHKSYPKERLEVFCAGKVIQLDNFKRLKTWGLKSAKKRFGGSLVQDKGHAHAVRAFLQAISKGEDTPINPCELWESAEVVFSLCQNGYWTKRS